MADLTVITLAYNEEINLPDCLDSVKDIAARLVVCDSFSTDKTLEIAKQHNADILQHEFINYASQYIFAEENSNINTKWVLRLDADERLTDEAREEIERICNENTDTDVSAVDVYYKVSFLGKELKHYPFHKVILYKYGKAHLENRNMDEHITVTEGRSIVLKNKLIHNDYKGLTAWVDKHNKYSNREVLDMLGENKEQVDLSTLSTATRIKRFIKFGIYYKLPMGMRSYLYYLFRLFIKGGILDGKEGRIFAFLQAYWYRYLVDAKMYEHIVNERSADNKNSNR